MHSKRKKEHRLAVNKRYPGYRQVEKDDGNRKVVIRG